MKLSDEEREAVGRLVEVAQEIHVELGLTAEGMADMLRNAARILTEQAAKDG